MLHDSAITFENDKCDEPVAYIVENDLLCNAALKEIDGLDTVGVQFNAKIKTCKYQEEEEIVTICLENGETITCNLLVSLWMFQRCCTLFYKNYVDRGVLNLKQSWHNRKKWRAES